MKKPSVSSLNLEKERTVLEKEYWHRFSKLFALVDPQKPEKGIQAMLAKANALAKKSKISYGQALEQVFEAAKERTERRVQLLGQCKIDTEAVSQKPRCSWALGNDLMRQYHDQEWGTPIHDDRLLFEFLILEGAQAGLSWDTVLKKREYYRKVFDNFNPTKIAKYDESKQQVLLNDPGIIRNRAKVASVVQNAQAFLKVQEAFGFFDAYIWQFVNHQPIIGHWKDKQQVPASTPESLAMSKDLKKRGFNFVGPTICYAFMQATGMVNDHTQDCFRYTELSR